MDPEAVGFGEEMGEWKDTSSLFEVKRPLLSMCADIMAWDFGDGVGALYPLPGMDSSAGLLPLPPFLLFLANRYQMLSSVGPMFNPF